MLLAGCAAAAEGGGTIRGSIYVSVIRGRIASTAGQTSGTPRELADEILLPEFEVGLVNEASGRTVASTKTDVIGRSYPADVLGNFTSIGWTRFQQRCR